MADAHKKANKSLIKYALHFLVEELGEKFNNHKVRTTLTILSMIHFKTVFTE